MAIAFNAATSASNSASATLTFAHTVSGSNTMLLVGFIANKATVPAVSSVTYNGVAMTATSASPLTVSATVKNHLYYLVNPTTGANNVVITFASAPDGIAANALSYTGAKQTGQPDSQMSTASTGATATLTTTTVANGSWLVGVFRNDSTGNGTAGGSTTQRSSIGGQCSMDDSGGLKAPAGSYSISETFGSAAYGALGISISPDTVSIPSTTGSGIATGASAGTSRTVAATVTGGNSNVLGLVFLWNTTGNSFGAVTWNGASMTSGAVNTPAFSFRSQYYYVAAPTTGNIVVNWTGADTSVGVAWVVLKDAVQGAPDVEGYVGVNQVATVTKSVTTTVANDLLLAGFAIQPTSSARVEGSGQGIIVAGSDNMGATNYYAEISSKDAPTSGSNAMALNWTTNRDADDLVVAIKYQVPATANSGFFMAAAS
jgi:hypothetical protein